MNPDPLSSLLGFALEEERPGYARLRAEARPEHCNFHGCVHGGFVFALADSAFAVAGNTRGPAVGIAAGIHYTQPAEVGDTLVAEAREVSLSRSLACYEVSVTGPKGLVATFTGTVYRRRQQGG